MEISRSFKPRRKKILLSTRRKMNVLLALNSDCRKCLYGSDKDFKSDYQNILDHGKEVMSFLQSEQFHIECLKQLKKCLIHPVLKGSIESVDDIIGLVDEMISTHSSLCSALIYEESTMSCAVKQLLACLDTYVSYSFLINLEMMSLQKCSETYDDIYIDFDLFQEPMTQVSRYKTLFQNLYNAVPMEVYCSILKAVEIASNNIQNALSVRKNALRTLQIQRFLFKREPKILSPGRTVLKEGILYKVDSKGSGLKERVFFLFNDIFLCCKVISKTADWHEENSLSFRALFPLNMCLVTLIMGSVKQGALFKVTCRNVSYLLISKIPGDAQSWYHELQTAIRTCQKNNVQLKPKLNQMRNICVKQRISPLLKQPFRSKDALDIQIETEDETTNVLKLHCKKSSYGKIIKLFACVNV